MKLSKRIPARTKTIEFNWCKKDFMKMNQRFRDIRNSLRKPMNRCFWCNHKFEDGEMMAIAQPQNELNKVLCQKCAEELLNSENRK